MRYRNPKTGAPCFCAHCRKQPITSPTVATAHEEPPTPPSLVDRIAGRPIATPPVFGGGQKLTVNAGPSDGVDDPPSLVAAIQSKGARR